jgi:cysteine desulfurase
MGTYMDTAATASYNEVDDIIVDTMVKSMKRYWQNPSSLYASDVKEEIDKCRANIAKFIGAKPEEIIFTSGASESNNMAIRGYADYMWGNYEKTVIIITTPIEHKSILKAIENPCLDAFAYYCDVDKYGMVDLNSLEELMNDRKNDSILVSICMANNEIGVIQDIKTISELVHKYNGILHVDATQALGHIPVNVEILGIDMMSCSGHKISPVLRGIGFLYKRNGINIQPIIYGAQEQNFRGGTENTYGIIGLSKAIEYCDISWDEIEKLISKRDYFINQLETKFGCKLNGHNEYRLPNNINVTFSQNITGESLLYMLEMSDVYVSTGSACNSHTNVPSHVLKEIGLTDDEAMRSVRFTLSDDITYEDIDKVIEEIDKSIKIITS